MSETGQPKKINRKIVIYGFFTILAVSVIGMFWTLGADLGEEKQVRKEAQKAEEARLSAMQKAEVNPEERAKEALAEAQKQAGVPVSDPVSAATPGLPPPPFADSKERQAAMMKLMEMERSRNAVAQTTPTDRERSTLGLSAESAQGNPDPARGGARTGFVMYAADPEGEQKRVSLKMQETVEREKREKAEVEKRDRVRQDLDRGRGLLYEHNDRVQPQDVSTASRIDGTHWLAAGTTVRAVLLNAVNTATPGTVTAKVIEDVYDSRYGRYLVIPAGSTLVGSYSSKVDYYQERISMQFFSLVTPGGAALSLRSTYGGDRMGVAGVPGELHTHLGKRVFATALGALGVELVDRYSKKSMSTVTQGGMTTTTNQSPTTTVVAEMAKKELDRMANEPFNITTDAGALLTVTLTENVEVPPVANRR